MIDHFPRKPFLTKKKKKIRLFPQRALNICNKKYVIYYVIC